MRKRNLTTGLEKKRQSGIWVEGIAFVEAKRREGAWHVMGKRTRV